MITGIGDWKQSSGTADWDERHLDTTKLLMDNDEWIGIHKEKSPTMRWAGGYSGKSDVSGTIGLKVEQIRESQRCEK